MKNELVCKFCGKSPDYMKLTFGQHDNPNTLDCKHCGNDRWWRRDGADDK